MIFCCNGCHNRIINFQGSAVVEGSKRTVVGLALQCNDPAEYARRMRALGKYHCQDKWGDGETCGFHPNTVCSCGNCDEDEELQC
ncbi:hypothetical protein QZH41_018767, partial [Actinostola sp. cb2023]